MPARHSSRSVLALALAVLFVPLLAAPVPGLADPPAARPVEALAWLAGAWIETREGTVIEEQWMAPRGGVMVGMSRSTGPDGKAFFEFMRIAPSAAGLSYFASPLGREPAEFGLVRLEERRVVFENRAHDFPQRIIYWQERTGELRARIEGTVDGKPQSADYRWSRAGG